ncbi:RluA family pseudouridine synthase [Vagococcus intermedius]|uniref:Pseudouridine synthase n=1 Tax=Vagococcus intermedius TaxID=2991418 RepID=A0AAF0CTM2_9ENTE|nr:RluA family pseudouridine synthase [Vagococcus intermedius]WEG72626.1 RluA family pseudouridine synthase [Vagococcus intermedius]WEG74711.1 RluA family pseudouridine synthase [Vagococcus intermedius]
MLEKLTMTIDGQKGRIDKVITEEFGDFSRSQIQAWLKEQLVSVNGEIVKPNYKVKDDDLIEINRPEPVELTIEGEDIPLEIVYEDQDVVVVNKPQGMVVHPSAGHANGTMVNALLHHVKDLSSINDVVRPGIVHRIDKDTSGLLMVAKNDEAHEKLSAQLKNKTVTRRYIALVHGEIPHDKGTIDAPVGRSKENRQSQAVIEGGKDAVTHFKVLERYEGYTLIECQLETGRTHQIRVHMKYIDYPLAGDPLYGPRKTLPGQGQFLHAKVLGFTHPTTEEEMYFEADLPENFTETLESLTLLTK